MAVGTGQHCKCPAAGQGPGGQPDPTTPYHQLCNAQCSHPPSFAHLSIMSESSTSPRREASSMATTMPSGRLVQSAARAATPREDCSAAEARVSGWNGCLANSKQGGQGQGPGLVCSNLAACLPGLSSWRQAHVSRAVGMCPCSSRGEQTGRGVGGPAFSATSTRAAGHTRPANAACPHPQESIRLQPPPLFPRPGLPDVPHAKCALVPPCQEDVPVQHVCG